VGFAVSVAEAPVHIIPSLFVVPEFSVIVMLGAGNELTVTVADAGAAQLVVVLVTVTE
jgi:hypothetical protein